MADRTKTEIDIEDLLVWTYRAQRADVIVGMGVGLYEQEMAAAGIEPLGVSGDGAFRVGRNLELRTQVDNSGGIAGAGKLHPDAETVHEAVMGLSRFRSGLIIQYARIAERPALIPPAPPRWVAATNREGKPKRIYDKNMHWIGYEIVLLTNDRDVENHRELYRMWRGGLAAMAAALGSAGDGLSSYLVTGPRARVAPWEKKSVNDSVIAVDFANSP